MMIDFCVYNIRGLNNKVSFMKDFIINNNLGLIAITETHVKSGAASSLSSFLAPQFLWEFNYEFHPNGRLWLGWDPSRWKINVISKSAQQISCEACLLAANKSFFLTMVYGYNTYVERRSLWTDLGLVSSFASSSPWAVAGDFNSYLHTSESVGSQGHWTTSMREFKDCILQLGLSDLRYIGANLTWCDSSVHCRIMRKLDRVIVNDCWLDNFQMSLANFLPRGLSDHSPSAVCLGVPMTSIKRPFQLFHHLLDHNLFLSEVKAAWGSHVSGDPWFILTSKLKRVKAAMIRLKRQKGNLHAAVINCRQALLNFQASLPHFSCPEQRIEETKLLYELKAAISAEEIILRQKARINWLKLGDENSISLIHVRDVGTKTRF